MPALNGVSVSRLRPPPPVGAAKNREERPVSMSDATLTAQQIPCRLCSAPSIPVFTAEVLNKHPVRYYECVTCGSLQTEVPFWLADAYRPEALATDVGIVERTIQLSLQVPVLLDRLGVDGSTACLDWGGGNGLFTRMMRDRGLNFRVHDKYVDNHYAPYFDVGEDEVRPFPVMTAFEVLEHLPDPAQDLEKIFRHDPDIFVTMTGVYQKQPADWWYLSRDNGQHVFFYSYRALQMIAERRGMQLLTNGNIHLFYRPKPKYLSYDENAVHRAQSMLVHPRVMMSEGLNRFAAHHSTQAYAFVSKDYQEVLARTRQARGVGPGTPPPANRLYIGIRRNPPQPRIVVDSVFFQYYRTGIARVWNELLRHWNETDFARNLVVLDRGGAAPAFSNIERRLVGLHSYDNLDLQRQVVEQWCREEMASLFISTYYSQPLTTPSVMMVHDMIPEVVGSDLNNPMWVEKAACIRHASRFVCVSNNTRADLERFHPGTDARAVVAHLGVAPAFRIMPDAERQDFRRRLGLEKGYFLVTGGLGGYKNGMAVVRALAGMPGGSDFAVVCTGPSADGERPKDLPPNIDVRFMRVDDATLCGLYNCATALGFPSLYEGFGMPLIEAQACGCPVITSDRPIMREVTANTALYIDPLNLGAMMEAMRRVQVPEIRQALVEAGARQVTRFSWARMADQVRELLERTAREAAVPA